MRTLIASVAAALVLAPAAGAWTKLTGDTLQNIVDPSVAVLPTGSELIAYREPVAGTFKVIHGGATSTVVAGRPIVGDGVILQTGSTLSLYFSDEQASSARPRATAAPPGAPPRRCRSRQRPLATSRRGRSARMERRSSPRTARASSTSTAAPRPA